MPGLVAMAADNDTPPSSGEPAGLRFEATVHVPSDAEGQALERVADLDLDRVPDPGGGVRVLVDLTDCERLVLAGFEVHLLRALPRKPLDPALVMDDAAARGWLAARVSAAGRSVANEEGER